MTSLPKQERIARWILLPIAIGLIGWGVFEFFHDDYRPPKEPTDPYDIEAKRVAHAIKLPDSIPTASYYPWWLGSERYFEFLCKHEAGEWIFKTVDNVEGVFQMRPRAMATSEDFEDRFAMEDPYGYIRGEAEPVFQFVAYPFRGYRYLETLLSPTRANVHKRVTMVDPEGRGGKFWRYTGEPKASPVILAEPIEQPKSRYGYTWRGIVRPHDREKGIAGGELIVLDLKTREVLGVRRNFVRTGNVNDRPDGINWEFAGGCKITPHPIDGKLVSKDVGFVYWFVSKILKPIYSVQPNKGGRDGR